MINSLNLNDLSLEVVVIALVAATIHVGADVFERAAAMGLI